MPLGPGVFVKTDMIRDVFHIRKMLSNFPVSDFRRLASCSGDMDPVMPFKPQPKDLSGSSTDSRFCTLVMNPVNSPCSKFPF